jgi:ADP-heptose:LPS heptosyltransferase
MTTRTQPQHILIVALDNLGDLVFASALTPPLHRAFPSATIDVWCAEYTAPVASLIPHVRHVVATNPFWGKSGLRPRGSLRNFMRGVSTVRRRRYDVAILSEAPWRVAAAVALAGIPRRIGTERHRNGFFLTTRLPPAHAEDPVVKTQATLLAPLGITSENAQYRLDADRLARVRAAVTPVLPPRYAAFHPFAGDRTRCVPLNEWTQLAFALQGRRLPVVWVGTRDELSELRMSYTHPKGYYTDEIEDGSLIVTAAILAGAELFVGHDSGPLHVAAAFGVPVVGVFAPGEPKRTFPQGPGPSRIVWRPTPDDVSAGMLLHEIDALGVASAT